MRCKHVIVNNQKSGLTFWAIVYVQRYRDICNNLLNVKSSSTSSLQTLYKKNATIGFVDYRPHHHTLTQ